jgi:hypothetical protein
MVYQVIPKSVQEIADVIGLERALLLVDRCPTIEKRDRRYPGRTRRVPMLYVPKNMRWAGHLVEVLGWEDAERMAEHFGGEILWPASCTRLRNAARNRAIVRIAHEKKLSRSEIADIFGVTERTVRYVLSKPTQ